MARARRWRGVVSGVRARDEAVKNLLEEIKIWLGEDDMKRITIEPIEDNSSRVSVEVEYFCKTEGGEGFEVNV